MRRDRRAGLVSFLTAFWRTVRRPPVARRCLLIALAVGTVLSVVNQGDAIVAARIDGILWLRLLANYAVPFVVSNLGAMASQSSDE